MKTRFLSLILAVLMTVGMLVSAIPAVSAAGGALPFRDVPANEWYVDSVRFVWERGIMNGTSAKTFGPEESMTRGQIVTILSRMSGDNVTGMKKEMNFKDVNRNEYYADPIGWAVKNGIAKGMSATTFEPDTPVLRQEFAAFFVRYMDYKGIKLPDAGSVKPFPDKATFPDWAVANIETLQKTGLVKGDNLGNFNPGNKMTRAEIATVTMRFVEAVPGEGPATFSEEVKASINDKLDEIRCVAHNLIDIQFGDRTTLTPETLGDFLIGLLELGDGYSVTFDEDEFDEMKTAYGGEGDGESVWRKISVTFVDKATGATYEIEGLGFGVRKDLYARHSGAVPVCALSWCRDDFTDDLVWDARDVLYDYDVDSDGFTTIELNTYTPETLEAFLRDLTGLADAEKYVFYYNWFDADAAATDEGNEVAVSFRNDSEGRTYCASAAVLVKIVP